MGGDQRFWIFFGSIWLLVGLGFFAGSIGYNVFADADTLAKRDVPLWIFTLAGFVLTAAGGFIIYRAMTIAARDRRLLQSGVQTAATVIDIERSRIEINRQSRWHVRYRYEHGGRTFDGRSRALHGEDVWSYKPGDKIAIRIDPQKPEESLFVGTR
jgi:Protein of unknown function (DUF3592)